MDGLQSWKGGEASHGGHANRGHTGQFAQTQHLSHPLFG